MKARKVEPQRRLSEGAREWILALISAATLLPLLWLMAVGIWAVVGT